MKKLIFTIIALMSLSIAMQAQKTCFADYTAHTDTTLTAKFYDSSTYGAGREYFKWNFGDSTATDTSKNPVHTFKKAGTYNVCETISDSLKKCSTTHCYLITVGKSTGTGCYAFFTAITDTTLTAVFSDKSYTKSGQTVRHWTFGDGDSSNTANPRHIYAAAGTYNVCEYIKDSINGCTTSYCTYITVGAKASHCKAFNTPYVDTSLTVMFIDSSYTGSGNIEFSWSFGDSTYSKLRNPKHTYLTAGIYNICETITDSITKCSNTYCYTIKVPYTVAHCSLKVFAKTDTTLTASFSDSLYTKGAKPIYKWTFGDGGSDSIASPSHTYSKPGSYNVCLYILNRDSAHTILCYTCDSVKVGLISKPCTAKFTVDSIDTVHTIIYITNKSIGADTTLWSFGDGDTSWSVRPTHTYLYAGSYNLCLYILCGGTKYSVYCDTISGANTQLTRSSKGYTIKVRTAGTGTQNVAKLNSTFKVYPNPFNQTFFIELPESITSGDMSIKNVLGQELKYGKLNNHKSEVDVKYLPAGIYLIQVKTSNGLMSKTIIKH